MFVVSTKVAPSNISNLFATANHLHLHETRFSSYGKVHVKKSRLNKNQESFARLGAKVKFNLI